MKNANLTNPVAAPGSAASSIGGAGLLATTILVCLAAARPAAGLVTGVRRTSAHTAYTLAFTLQQTALPAQSVDVNQHHGCSSHDTRMTTAIANFGIPLHRQVSLSRIGGLYGP